MRRALVITNSDAGSNDDTAVADAVDVLRAASIDVLVEATSSPSELTSVLARRDGRDVVVVAGGDGSLHAVVAALYDQGELGEVVVGLIPLGTGNDFARGVGIALDPVEAAQIVVAGHQQPIDVLIDDGEEVVINAVHAGVGADAGREAQAWKPKLGKLGYVVGALLAGVKTKGHRLRVEADGAVVTPGERRVLQVGIGNGAYVGGGTPLTPTADPGDGKVDVVVSFAVSPLDRLRYAVHLKRGTHAERHDVREFRATSVSVSGPEFWCNADGELIGPYTARRWRVLPAALSMAVPRGQTG